MKRTIEVYNHGNLPTAPLDDFLELQEDFKIPDLDKNTKLQMLIITRGFKYSFKAWRDPEGKLWIIDAHQRRKALLSLRKSGFDIPPIPYEPIHAENKQEAVEEIAAYNSEFATKNPDTLLFQKYGIEMDTLERFNLPFEVKPVEFTPSEKLFAQETENTEIQEDDPDLNIPEDNSGCFVKPGDIWLLGNNRLMCGDCRNNGDVKMLMDGKLAHASVTDPPYNVSYQGATEDQLTIDNDSMENDLFATFLRQVFDMMFKWLCPGAANYVFHADSEGENFRAQYRKAGFKLAQCCVWVKNMFVMGRQDYQWKHEPVLYGWKPGAAHFWNSDRKQSTVWLFDKPQRNAMHPTMKPIALMAYPVMNSTKPGKIVIDFFSGSGSTLMACQQIDRICHAMEIEPRYATGTVLRFMAMFSKQPVKLIRNGKEYTMEETKAIINEYRKSS